MTVYFVTRPCESVAVEVIVNTYEFFVPEARTPSISASPGVGPSWASEVANPCCGWFWANCVCAKQIVRSEPTAEASFGAICDLSIDVLKTAIETARRRALPSRGISK